MIWTVRHCEYVSESLGGGFQAVTWWALLGELSDCLHHEHGLEGGVMFVYITCTGSDCPCGLLHPESLAGFTPTLPQFAPDGMAE